MSQTTTLADRIDAAFAAAEQKIKQLQKQHVEQYQERQQRVEKLEQVLDELREISRPRLETLAKKFADRVKVTPHIVPGRRQATFEVDSDLARVVMKFSVTADEDVRNLVFLYDLEILPIFMKFESHSELQLPLEKVDKQALAAWIDERIMSFIGTYMALYENSYYLQDHLVEDPIAKVRFPKFAAAAKLEGKGNTTYFISEETRRQYEQQQKSTSK
jgi:YHS domain-containing protein